MVEHVRALRLGATGVRMLQKLGAILLTSVTLAIALASPAHASWRAVCREDAGRLCPPDQKPQTMLQCLQQHRTELSVICAKRLPQPKPAGAKPAAGCSADVERFCKDLTGRPAAMLQCLNGHKD